MYNDLTTMADILAIKSQAIDFKNKKTLSSNPRSLIYQVAWKKDASNPGKETVAIKKLTHIRKDTHTAAEYYQEAKMMWLVQGHDNIVKLHGMVENAISPMLVMEFINSSNLKIMLLEKDHREWVKTNRLSIAKQVLAGIAYIHARHIIHRDIKNENIFLTKEGIVKIGDFEFAVEEMRKEYYAAIPGTINWVAPEAYFDSTFTCASDMHHIGSLLWSLYSFCEPLNDVKIKDINTILKQYPRETITPDTPEEVKKIILNLWSLDPKIRETADQVKAKIHTITL